MPWARLDDAMTFHPKILDAGNAAVGVWVRMITNSAAHGLNGFCPDATAKAIGTPREIASAVTAGLLVKVEGGYQVHDYLDYQPAAGEVADRRQRRSDAGRKGGRRSGDKRRSKIEANSEAKSKQMLQQNGSKCEAKYEANTQAKTNPDPDPEEKIQRAREDIGQRWARICHVLMAPAGDLLDADELIRQYAEKARQPYETVAESLLQEFYGWVQTWDVTPSATPVLFVKHFSTVQGLFGKRTVVRETGAERVSRLAAERRGDL